MVPGIWLVWHVRKIITAIFGLWHRCRPLETVSELLQMKRKPARRIRNAIPGQMLDSPGLIKGSTPRDMGGEGLTGAISSVTPSVTT